MAGDFYDRQINKIDINDKLREYDGLVKDYLNTSNIEESNLMKNLIINKAIQELSITELSIFKDNLSEKGQRESGKNKMKIYELAAGLYNNTPISNQAREMYRNDDEYNPNKTYKGYRQHPERDYYNNIPIEVADVRVLGEEKMILRRQNITPIGNGRYEINLELSKPRGKWINAISNINVIIEYRGGNVINIINPDYPDRIINQVPIRNKREINLRHGNIYEPNLFVTIPFKHYKYHVEMDLSIPNR